MNKVSKESEKEPKDIEDEEPEWEEDDTEDSIFSSIYLAQLSLFFSELNSVEQTTKVAFNGMMISQTMMKSKSSNIL